MPVVKVQWTCGQPACDEFSHLLQCTERRWCKPAWHTYIRTQLVWFGRCHKSKLS